ncbi:NAD(P)H nitroreductase [Mycolicibacterium duvalii]|uniref:Acg family FMN-binding oxidoreductase n=1 Tax=Mycolicibacterium duvalii TaxID=39688 RepID=UPI000BEEE208|nr:NAD(P)H nitroreductase [Mycolicibacterium duvalii]MCV7368694.1 NAD(P)H nitroreductase [Mycolicibacterium duvalii]PEG35635.1 NAD(P)H nitroreductase [Mycolicibacterium duvalii]
MNAQFPDAETLRSALALAARAPSVHNSQPWQWRVGEHSLHLYANPDLLLSHTDPDGRDLLLSCGAALNHCAVALAALGWQAKIHRFPNPADPCHLAAVEVYRYPAAELDIALAAAIPRRRTDRRHYSSWPVPRGDIALMGARAARAGVILRRIDDLEALRRLVDEAASRHLADPGYLTELTTWSGRYASTAGVPARSVPGANGTGSVPLRSFAGGVLAQPEGVEADEENAVVVALGTVADDRLSRLRAGEAASIVMLTATAQGLASCPITEPLEVPDTRATVRSDVFGADAYPQIMLRIGWAPVNADPLPSTPRRDIAEFVTTLDGAPIR